LPEQVRLPEQQSLLLLAPSAGLGGGIERYLSAVVQALVSSGVSVDQLALFSAATKNDRQQKVRFSLLALRASRALGRSSGTARIVAAHPSLVAPALLCRAISGGLECHVIFYGTDIWAASRLTKFLVRRAASVRPICISSFGAGAVSGIRVGATLRPGFTRRWFETLVDAGDRSEARGIQMLTVLRLGEWRAKGVPELLEASCHHSLRPTPEAEGRLVIAGMGPVTSDLERAVRAVPHAELVVSPTDEELASLYADSRVLVLATRTRSQGERTGEGFGIVLAEAQIAGCPVVAPAAGGSEDAYVEGLTGVRPMGEGVAALAEALEFVLADERRWQELSNAAATWARRTFDPDRYASLAHAVFFPP